jgi:hypothetical protein
LWGLSLLLCVGCGYSAHFKMPEGVDSVAIEVFRNRTLYREVDFEFTNALRREISAKTPLKIEAADQADALFTGEILDYRRYVLREDRNDVPTEFRVVIDVSYQVKDLKTGKVIAENKRMRRGEDYQLRRGQVEPEARAEAIRRLARNVVQDAFHRWE